MLNPHNDTGHHPSLPSAEDSRMLVPRILRMCRILDLKIPIKSVCTFLRTGSSDFTV